MEKVTREAAPELMGQRQPSFCVYIIESPSHDDFYRGRSEADILGGMLRLAGIPVAKFTTTNEETFVAAFHDVIFPVESKQTRFVVLHMSFHGTGEGIVLTEGTEITWDRLGKFFSALNERLDFRLIVSMSSCKGFGFCKSIATTWPGPSPFLLLIGPAADVSWSDLLVAYTTFYHLLAKDIPPPDAVEAMKVASGNHDFGIVSASDIREIFEKYLQRPPKNR